MTDLTFILSCCCLICDGSWEINVKVNLHIVIRECQLNRHSFVGCMERHETSVYVCMYAYVRVRVCVCACVCVCSHSPRHTHTHTYTYMHAMPNTHIIHYICTCASIFMYQNTRNNFKQQTSRCYVMKQSAKNLDPSITIVSNKSASNS